MIDREAARQARRRQGRCIWAGLCCLVTAILAFVAAVATTRFEWIGVSGCFAGLQQWFLWQFDDAKRDYERAIGDS